ncbi:MAG TPA: hypothetical protein VK196_06660 [Magnetospirillum sp.]|nr:hypothetical protein [Magnetospirillum sp.]
MNLVIAVGCLALAVAFAVQAVASLRTGIKLMGLMTAITAASTAFIGIWVLWGS